MNELFITKFIQDGKSKPKKFKHYVRLPRALFVELLEEKVIDPERYYIDGVAFFQIEEETVTVNFLNLYHSEDFYAKVTNYLLISLMGFNPIVRGGIFY